MFLFLSLCLKKMEEDMVNFLNELLRVLRCLRENIFLVEVVVRVCRIKDDDGL